MPLSWLYGAGVAIRGALFDSGALKSVSYPIPVIDVGNITVGGTGKTPHVEMLIRLLKDRYRVAVLSRGYKRHTHGYVLASPQSTMEQIGDEPWQVKQKFPDIHVAVDSNRRRGIQRLMQDAETRDVQVILLDDAFQHRYVKAGLDILLVDYHRIITDDYLLPAGRLREPASARSRASMVIVTKCPADITPMGYRVVQAALKLKPYQQLFFSTLNYGTMHQLWGEGEMEPAAIRRENMHVLLLTGIGNPQQMEQDVRRFAQHIQPLTFSDHHYYSERDAAAIEQAFRQLPQPRIIVTTEKDATRLRHLTSLSQEVHQQTYVLPIVTSLLRGETEKFNQTIIDYVQQDT